MTKTYNIIVLDCTHRIYNPDLLKTEAFGGIQNTINNFAKGMHERGHQVIVVNNTPISKDFDGVYWANKQDDISSLIDEWDPVKTFVITNNDPTLFYNFEDIINNGAHPVLWSRNALTLKRFIKDQRWKAYFKFKPIGVFLSHFSLKQAPFYYRFSKKLVIPHSLDPLFTSQECPTNKKQEVVFMSHPNRGMKCVVDLWLNKINPALPDAKFKIFCEEQKALRKLPYTIEQLNNANIHFYSRLTKKRLKEEIQSAKALFYPGSKDETFCNVALEAQASGMIVITKGLGSLSERVNHAVDGYIEQNDTNYANALIRILKDDKLYNEMSQNAFDASKEFAPDLIFQRWEDTLFASVKTK